VRTAIVTLLLLLLGVAPAVPASLPPIAQPSPCVAARFEGSHFTVCRYQAGVDELRLVSAGPHGPIGSLRALRSALGAEAARVAFAVNAGMYDVAQRPLGLFVARGRELRPLNRAGGGGNQFYAYDKATGAILSQMTLPANQSGVPMTYAVYGRQYIVVATGARDHPGELIALTLP